MVTYYVEDVGFLQVNLVHLDGITDFINEEKLQEVGGT